ncbi:MAG: hypothetical protein HDT28_09655 [Clostridiales bacterium]|nr:hypothetical protein [Clostridiales bacterium]
MDIERIRGFIMMMRPADKAVLVGGEGVVPSLSRPKVDSCDFGDFLQPYALSEIGELAIGCTFSPKIARAVAEYNIAQATEARYAFAGVVHAGLIRDPMSPSAAEFFSEDAYLTSELLSSFDDEYGIGFIYTDCLGQGRFVNRTVDTRALRELYLMPLRFAGSKASGVQLDGGYLNGEKVCESKTLCEIYTDYIKKEATLFTQYGDAANGSSFDAIGSGCAYLLGADQAVRRALAYDIANGVLDERTTTRVIERTLAAVVNSHEFYNTDKPREQLSGEKPNLAIESTVLLKNDGTLPYSGKNITVFGAHDATADSAKFSIIPIKDAPKKLGALNVFIITDYEENGIDHADITVIAGAAAASKTVVIIKGSCATPLDGVDCANAVMFCPYDVRVTDIVEMLTTTAPSGRLPFTWCKSKTDYPVNNKKYTARGDFRYESTYNGYALFNNFDSNVSYPFGHGLDYTSYEISRHTFNAKSEGAKITVEFVVKNAGELAGVAVCQAYITLIGAPVYGISRRLAAFKRIPLERKESEDVTLEIDLNKFAVFDESADEFFALGGKYRIDIGFSSKDIRLSCEVKVGLGSRSNAGLNKKTAPAYYNVDGKFDPTAPEIEKLLKVPFIKKPDERPELAPPTEASVKKKLKKFEKKIPAHLLPLFRYKVKTTPERNS